MLYQNHLYTIVLLYSTLLLDRKPLYHSSSKHLQQQILKNFTLALVYVNILTYICCIK